MRLRYPWGRRDLAEVPKPRHTGIPTRSTAKKPAAETFRWSPGSIHTPERLCFKGRSREGEITNLPKHRGKEEEGSKRLVPPVSRALTMQPAPSFLMRASRNENGTEMVAAAGGRWLGKGFGNWNLWGFLATMKQGEILIPEMWYFNQKHSRWETSCTVSFLASHLWAQRLPCRLPRDALRDREGSPKVWRGSLSWIGSLKPLH